MSSVAPLDEAWTLELRKYFSARRVWPVRDQQAGPIKLRGGEEWSGTQAEWFEMMYGESIDAFADRARREDLKSRVETWKRENDIGQPTGRTVGGAR